MCSLRSWPTQKARPVPVSTTHRTAASSATWRTAASSASLVATSRLFIASGRLRVMVATPSATSSRTGDVSRSCPQACHTPRQRATNRSEAGLSRAASLVNRSAAAWPGQSRGAAPPGRPGSAKRNLRHSCTSRKRAANAACPRRRCRPSSRRGPSAVRHVAATRRTTWRGRPGPTPPPGRASSSTATRVAGARRRPARTTSSTSGRSKRAQPDAGRVLGVPEEVQLLAQPGRAHRARGAGRRTRAASGRPTARAASGRSGRPPRRAARWPVGWRGSPGAASTRAGSSQPWRTSARSPCAPREPRSRPAPAAGSGPRRAPGRRASGGGRRTRRTGPTVHACGHSASSGAGVRRRGLGRDRG